MLLECSVGWSAIQVEGVVYRVNAEGLFDVDNASHAAILLSSPKWTEKPKGTFKEVKPEAVSTRMKPVLPPPPPKAEDEEE